MNRDVNARIDMGRSRVAFSLVELLVIVAIVAGLAAVLLPAVHAARESARLAVCRHHVGQLATALMHHESAWRHYPSGGWGSTWLPVDGRPADSAQPGGWTYAVLPYLEANAVRDMLAGADVATAASVYATFAATAVPVFACPSRRPAAAIAMPTGVAYRTGFSGQQSLAAAAVTDFAANGGSTATCPPLTLLERALSLVNGDTKVTFCHVPAGSGNQQTQSLAISATEQGHADHAGDHIGPCGTCEDDMATVAQDPTSLMQGDAWRFIPPLGRIVLPDGGIPDLQDGILHRMSQVTAAAVKDGVSMTYLLGEKNVAADRYRTGTDAGDDRAMYAGYSSSNVRWAIAPPRRDVASRSWPNAFGGPHAVGWTAAFGDGAVRTISFDIDLEVHRGLAARADGRASLPQ